MTSFCRLVTNLMAFGLTSLMPSSTESVMMYHYLGGFLATSCGWLCFLVFDNNRRGLANLWAVCDHRRLVPLVFFVSFALWGYAVSAIVIERGFRPQSKSAGSMTEEELDAWRDFRAGINDFAYGR